MRRAPGYGAAEGRYRPALGVLPPVSTPCRRFSTTQTTQTKTLFPTATSGAAPDWCICCGTLLSKLAKTRMTRKIAGERRRAGEREDEFDSRIKGLKLHVIVTTRFLSQAPLDFFFGKFFFFRYGLDTFLGAKKKPNFFFSSVWTHPKAGF